MICLLVTQPAARHVASRAASRIEHLDSKQVQRRPPQAARELSSVTTVLGTTARPWGGSRKGHCSDLYCHVIAVLVGI